MRTFSILTMRTGGAWRANAGRSVGGISASRWGLLEQVRGMKTRSSVKKLCEGCKVCFGEVSFWCQLG
jgi:ribosomal protein L36